MSSAVDFSRQEILSALRDVGEALFQRGKIGDIAVFGGSAIILQFDVSFITQDVDAIVVDEHGEVMRAVQEVADRRGWNRSWLNEGVSVYLSSDAGDNLVSYGDFPSVERVGLRVYVATAQYLLSLKLRALRLGTRDLDDVVLLARHLGLRTVEDLMQILRNNFPNEPLDDRRRLMLSDLVKQFR